MGKEIRGPGHRWEYVADVTPEQDAAGIRFVNDWMASENAGCCDVCDGRMMPHAETIRSGFRKHKVSNAVKCNKCDYKKYV